MKKKLLLSAMLATIFVFITLSISDATILTSPSASAPSNQPLSIPSNVGWEEIGSGSAEGGGISDSSGTSWRPSLAIGPNNTPIIAWADDSVGNHEIYVRQWNGSSWAEMGSSSASGGGISNNTGESSYPSLEISHDGTPFIAWEDSSTGDSQIYIRRWNGVSWEAVGSESASGGGISNNSGASWDASIAIGPDGVPSVAWMDWSNGDAEIYVRSWNGSAWVEMGKGSASGGGISDNNGDSWLPSLDIGLDRTPIIAWYDNSSGNDEIYVRRWDGSAWVEMGMGSASGGGISKSSGNSWYPSLAAAPDGTAVIAWGDDSNGNWEIYVRKWNGDSWEEIGNGSASGGGISNNSGTSIVPSLAISPTGTYIISWENWTHDNKEVYVRHWNGTDWVEMENGSASDGGISDNSGDSVVPSLAIRSDGRSIISWEDNSGSNVQIYVRQYGQSPYAGAFLPLVSYTISRFVGPNEREPNDTPHKANGAIYSGKSYRGAFIDKADLADYFFFYMNEENEVHISLSQIPQGRDYDLYLYDRDNRKLSHSNESENKDESIVEDLTNGLYYILVHNPYGEQHPDSYELRATFE